MQFVFRILLFVVLTAHLVRNHCIECLPGSVCGLTPASVKNIGREDEDVNHLDKILGASFVTYGEFPWMVAILYNDKQMCGGAVISEFWIITAAHCLEDGPQRKYKIVVADNKLSNKDLHEETYELTKIIINERYRSKQFNFDIALGKIKAKMNGRGIEFNSYVQPVCLADSTDDAKVGTRMLFSGWGWTSGSSGRSIMLKKAILPVAIYDRCKKIYPKAISTNVFCAGDFNGAVDLCRGDSGGPLVKKVGETFVLYGIAAFSSGCQKPNYPTAFSSIPKYRSWIDSTIRRNSFGSEGTMPARNLYTIYTLPPP